MTLYEGAPYRNLTLTGPMGAGKTSIGRAVARQLGAAFFDLETEILSREGQSADEIRELFGESRLNALEANAIRDLSLHRHAVLVISGPAMLDEANRARLIDTGPVLTLTCAVNEILRRLYVTRGAWFHNPNNRATLISRLKREWRVTTLDLPRLDTTALTIEEASAAVIEFWLKHAEI